MYNRVALVSTVNVYIPASLAEGKFSGTRNYRYLSYLRGCLVLAIVLEAYKLYYNSPLNLLDKNKVSDCK
jgi:hypothetical protein